MVYHFKLRPIQIADLQIAEIAGSQNRHADSLPDFFGHLSWNSNVRQNYSKLFQSRIWPMTFIFFFAPNSISIQEKG